MTLALADDDDADRLPGRTQDQLSALQNNLEEVIETSAFYAAMSVLLVVLVVWAVVQRRISWAFYASIVLTSLWWIALHEQNLSGMFWISPELPTSLLTLIGIFIAAINALVAAAVARTSEQSKLSLLLFGTGLLCLPIWLITRQLDDSIAISVSVAVFGVSALCHLVPMIDRRSLRDRLSVGPIKIVALMLTIVGIVVLTGEFHEELDLVFLNRMAAALLTTAFVLLFLYRNRVTLAERDLAVRQSIEDAQREAKTAKALWEAEKNYSKARELADTRAQRLATASHDIRQPIAALRTTMASLTQTDAPEVRDQMNIAFDYLNDLAATYIQEGKGEGHFNPAEAERLDPKEIISASLIAKTIKRMFQSEAEQKGLVFSVNVTEKDIIADPLKLMRVLSNLTSNAVKHTVRGQVSISGKSDGTDYIFEVVNSAPFPDEFDPNTRLEPYQKGADSEGSGLGLSIVKEIAEQEEFEFELKSRPDGQTSAEIYIPMTGRKV